jgi:hypothetical protein
LRPPLNVPVAFVAGAADWRSAMLALVSMALVPLLPI